MAVAANAEPSATATKPNIAEGEKLEGLFCFLRPHKLEDESTQYFRMSADLP
ncbi:hypothetical protein Vi05172_g2749 [Venturia inaequalis]|nr:hypothetical protein Vi05172_g2749 [Venturia inaequalis]